MKSYYWTTFSLWLAAVAGTSAQSVNIVMTWYIGRNETVQFTGDTFAQFSRCVCSRTQTNCTIYTKDGFMSYVQWENSGSTQGYTSTYLCERHSTVALTVGCSRLDLSSCSYVDSHPFWSFRTIINSQEACGIGQVKIIWKSTQQFQMTYNNTSLTISKGNLTCPSSSAPAGTTVLPTQPSQSTTNSSSCFPKCSTTPETNITTHGINNKTTQSGDDNDTGVIVGVVVALVVCAVLVAVVLVLWWRKKKAQKAQMYGSSQLWSQPVEIINGGFNGFAEQGSQDRSNGNAHVTDSTEPSYATVSADHAIVSGNNASYYNLRHNGNTSALAYEDTGGTASATSSDGDRRNIRHFGQDADGYEVPLPAPASQTLSHRYPNTRQGTVKGDGMDYEDVDDSPSACLQTSHDNGSQSQSNYDSYDVSVSPGAGHLSYKDTMSKDDHRYESVHLGGPRPNNVYSEIGDNADNTNLDDIVPPKRNRFSQPPTQAPNLRSSVYELAQHISEGSANPDASDGTGSTGLQPYARPMADQSTPVNPDICEEGNGDVYDSGSHTYFELESRASIRVEDTDI